VGRLEVPKEMGVTATSNSHANLRTGSPSPERRRAAGVGFLREDGTDGSRGPGLCFTVPSPEGPGPHRPH
jgi:hypothetical protein